MYIFNFEEESCIEWEWSADQSQEESKSWILMKSPTLLGERGKVSYSYINEEFCFICLCVLLLVSWNRKLGLILNTSNAILCPASHLEACVKYTTFRLVCIYSLLCNRKNKTHYRKEKIKHLKLPREYIYFMEKI